MGRVIKADRHGAATIPAVVHDAQRRAASILEEAQRRAQHELAQARAEGMAQGLAEGRARATEELAEGRARATEELAEGRARATEELARLVAARSRVLREAEHDAMKASLQVAEHLMRTTVETKPEVILAMLAPLLARIRNATFVRVRAHEADAPLVETYARALAKHVGLDGEIHVVVDAGLERGDLRLESNVGELDSRIAIRLEDLEASWRGRT